MSEGLELDERFRCGLMLAAGNREDLRSQALRLEALGFDSAWVGDHVSFHVPMLESLTSLAFVAAVTERIQLGTAVYLAPLRHPTLIAKIAGTLDVLCAGRLVLGVGVGGEFPPEFEACSVPVAERGSRTDEALPLLRRLWSESAVTHRGRHFSFGPVSLDPRPHRTGGPPLWVGGRRAPAFRRAGRLGDGYISHMTSAARYRENLDTIARHAREAQRTPVRFGTGALLFTVLDPSYDAALERASGLLGRIYQQDFREAARKYCLLGRPEDCLEQLQAFASAGCRHFMLAPLSDPRDFAERVAGEILPQARQLAP